MNREFPIARDIVLLGGGHSHVEVIKRFAMSPLSGVRINLVTPDLMASYSGMLPGTIAGHYSPEQSHIDLRRLCQFANVRLYHSRAEGINWQNSSVLCQGHPAIPFDVLSIDIGSTPNTAPIKGAAEHAIAVKPVSKFLSYWDKIKQQAVAQQSPVRIVIVGAGAGGVELCLAMQHALAQRLAQQGLANQGLANQGLANQGLASDKVSFTLVSDQARVLASHALAVGERLSDLMQQRRIELLTSARVEQINQHQIVYCKANEFGQLDYDVVILTTQAQAAPWLRDTGLTLDENGFIKVNQYLQSISHPQLFAAGDIASLVDYKLAKSGVYAVRQGPFLAANLRRYCEHKPLKPYRPQRRTLALISTGDKQAVASWGKVAMVRQGKRLWQFKDWLDRRWLRRYQELPAQTPMPSVEKKNTQQDVFMRCAGCGSKIPHAVLSNALNTLTVLPRDDVIVGLKQADDAAILTIAAGQRLLQSVDFFPAMLSDPWLFARIATQHALNDIYAMGGQPHSALALVTLPAATVSKQQQELTALLQGANEELTTAGASLLGGHTIESDELIFGLSVNGVLDATQSYRQALAEGDALILTKALGTGVIFAADMRAAASADVVSAAIDSMLMSNQNALMCLQTFGVKAITDVSGFGLMGHLQQLLRPHKLTAQLHRQALPLLPGVMLLFEQGFASTLQPENQKWGQLLMSARNHQLKSDDPDPYWASLFDPQTSGGLLAVVPKPNVQPCLKALEAAGYVQSRCIGTLVEAEQFFLSEE